MSFKKSLNEKHCIFHIPNKLDENSLSGSNLRPKKMIQAFQNIGYNVEVVKGYGKDRRKCINHIKNNIKKGMIYDFVYSESSTMPTLLTEKNHLPLFPNLDFGFLKFCKRNGIPVGLFYRDLYWKFPNYKEDVKGLKYLITQIAYRYDLLRYEDLLNIFFVPTKKVGNYLNSKRLSSIVKELPPGGEYKEKILNDKKKFLEKQNRSKNSFISLFYVGGIGSNYRFEKLLKSIQNLNFIDLVICCRENEWESNKVHYQEFITDRVKIVHASGDGLKEYYEKATISLAFFEQDEYRTLAMPVKIFEYMSYGLPVIVSNNTAVADFVNNSDIGWVIDYDEDSLRKLLFELYENFQEVQLKFSSILRVLKDNTWESRAKVVRDELINSNESRR